MTWSSSYQVDSWVNLSNGRLPDDWVRVSLIARVRMVEGAECATVVLRDKTQVATGFTAKELMRVITDSRKGQSQ